MNQSAASAGPARRATRQAFWTMAGVIGILGGHLAGAVGSPPVPNLEEDIPLEQLGQIPVETVSTASRYRQNVTDAPASVSIITSDQFQEFGYRTLGDALNSLPGIYTSNDRTYSYLGMRGFSLPGDYNSRVLILVDGHRVNDNIFEGAYIGHEFILNVDSIDRVEVVRGPSSSLYGSSAFLGVVNVITKRAAAVADGEVSASAGSRGSYEGRFTYGGMLTNLEAGLLVSGSFYDSAGQPRLYFPAWNSPTNNVNNGIAEHLDHEQACNLFSSLTWRDLTLEAGYVSRIKDIPTASYGTLFNDPRYHALDEHGYLDLKLQHQFGADTELMARSYFDDVRYSADYPLAAYVSPQDQGLNRDRVVGQRLGWETQLTHRWREHTLTAGAEVRDDLRQDQQNYDVAPRFYYADEHHHNFDAGVYAQGEFELRTNLHFNAGVRFDKSETSAGTVNPRLALIYTPVPDSTFKLLYGTAFRAPNEYELHFPVGAILPTARLAPEAIQSYELDYEQGLPANLRLSLAGYYNHINDLIALNQKTLLFENSGKVQAEGAELGLHWRHASGVRAQASYSLQHSQWVGSGEGLPNSPQHLVKFNLRAPLGDERILGGVELQYTSAAGTLFSNTTGYADGFYVLNLTLLSRELVKNVELSASVYNLLDTRYSYPAGAGSQQDLIEQDGRGFRVKLTYRF